LEVDLKSDANFGRAWDVSKSVTTVGSILVPRQK